jgi:hypothetical protein
VFSSGDNALKAGSGIGNDFCQNIQVRNFCLNNSAARECPSCTRYFSLPPSDGPLPDICKTDPLYSTQATAASDSGVGSAGLSAGSSVPSSGAASALGGAGQVAQSVGEKKTSSGYQGLGLAGAGGAGGGSVGGFSGYGGASAGSRDEGESMRLPLSSRLIGAGGLNSRGLASTTETAAASDVETMRGPTVFAISSAVLRRHCESGKFLHCEKGR